MATPTEKFRSALNGFNRTDVVQFIQRQTAEHEKALRLAREESARLSRTDSELREETACLKEQLAALQAEKEALIAERDRLLAEKKALQEELAAVRAMREEAVQAAVTEAVLDRPIQPVSLPSEFNEMELAAYRRAEQTERLSRERAAASAERMKNIFEQADAKLTLTATDLAAVMNTCQSDFAQMQELLNAAKAALGESSDSLKAAAELCDI